jgi:hypothetical protein
VPALTGLRLPKFLLLTAALALPGCAGLPTGPSVMVLPGDGKTAEQFRAEDVRCRQMASADLRTAPAGTVPVQGRFDMVYMQCMYAEGNQIPVAGRGWRSRATDRRALPSDVPPPAAGAPPPPPPQPAR